MRYSLSMTKIKENKMKKAFLLFAGLLLTACAQDPYRLKISNTLAREHGQSVYFRSGMRSNYAGDIRRVLSGKFGEIGMKTATSAENADFIAIFDIDKIYKSDDSGGARTLATNSSDVPLFADGLDGRTQDYVGNPEIKADKDKTCFTLKIGRKNTSSVSYDSYFCSDLAEETEDLLPKIIDVYGKYGNYESANVGMQCLTDISGKVECNPVRDPRQAFIKSLWIDHEITED